MLRLQARAIAPLCAGCRVDVRIDRMKWQRLRPKETIERYTLVGGSHGPLSLDSWWCAAARVCGG